MENKFLKYYANNKKDELKSKWKILDYLEEETPIIQKSEEEISDTSVVKVSEIRKMFIER